jgi:hypothetical protein
MQLRPSIRNTGTRFTLLPRDEGEKGGSPERNRTYNAPHMQKFSTAVPKIP